jgi:hypothetical protein
MDFSGRGSQPAQPASTNASFGGGASGSSKKNKNSDKHTKAMRYGGGVLGLLVLVLVVAVIGVIAFGGKSTEAKYVDESKLQAVFLQTGQVYFGKIDKGSVTGNSFVMNDIYYLQTSSTGAAEQTSNTNVSLVKLGCELHAPRDQMVINRDQVTFWENLNETGQVAKAVETFQKDNPDGQKCADQGTAPNTTTNVQGTPTTNTNGASTAPTTNSGN